MTTKKYPSNCALSNLKIYDLMDQSLSLRTNSEDRKNTDRFSEKNYLQKYLNLYESIERRQNLVNDQPYKPKRLLQVKKYTNHKKSIFQNPLIQSSCSQICNEAQRQFPQHIYHSQLPYYKVQRQQLLLKSTPIPSKKNQMALAMIGENKIFYSEENIQESNALKMEEKNNNNEVSPFNTAENFYDSKVYPQVQKNNILAVQSPQKQYKGYYKTKNQQLYKKQSERKLRNSSNFIFGIDKSIEIQKSREMIIRPKSSNPRSQIRRQTFRNYLIDGGRSLIFSSQQSPHKIQSEAKFISVQKMQSQNENNRLIKKNKNCLAHKINYQPLRSFSYHPNDEKENRKSTLKLSITTETPLKQNFFITREKQLYQSLKLNDSPNSKTSLQKKHIKNIRMTEKSPQHTPKIISVDRSRNQSSNYQMTLNKIQDSIANDIQISIRQLDVAA